jgi:hypothetical protein
MPEPTESDGDWRCSYCGQVVSEDWRERHEEGTDSRWRSVDCVHQDTLRQREKERKARGRDILTMRF